MRAAVVDGPEDAPATGLEGRKGGQIALGLAGVGGAVAGAAKDEVIPMQVQEAVPLGQKAGQIGDFGLGQRFGAEPGLVCGVEQVLVGIAARHRQIEDRNRGRRNKRGGGLDRCAFRHVLPLAQDVPITMAAAGSAGFGGSKGGAFCAALPA
jgi:hypothetical protein